MCILLSYGYLSKHVFERFRFDRCTHLHIFVCTFMYVHLCMYVYVCTFLYVYIYVCMWVYHIAARYHKLILMSENMTAVFMLQEEPFIMKRVVNSNKSEY